MNCSETKLKPGWIDMRKRNPDYGSRVLVCDEYGHVDIVVVESVENVHQGKMDWLEAWRFGNGTNLVAWMPLPEWPEKLCHEDADGQAP